MQQLKIKMSSMQRYMMILVIALPFCSLSHLISKQLTTSSERFPLGLCWICVASLFVFVKTASLRCSESSKLVIMAGYIVRIIIAFWGTYGTGSVIGFLNTGDQVGFLDTAMQYYKGDFSSYYTKYPYILLWIFRITGPNRMMPQLVNIMIWYLGILILEKIAGELYGRSKCLLLCLYVFMPWPLLISTQLYRETMMSLLMMLVYYFLWKWMKRGNFIDILCSILFIIPLFLLHSGNIAMLPVIFIVYIQWDYRTQKWRMFSKKWVLVFLGLIFIPVFFKIIIPRFGEYLPAKISLQSLTNYAYVPGRTDYIPEGVGVNNWLQFVFWTIYRMIYFWISPSPRLWSSMLDVVCFFVDVVPWVIMVIGMFCVSHRQKNPQAVVGIFFLLLYTFVYGWGTRNAGTAMRHRDQCLGIMIMAALMETDRDGGREISRT